MKTRLIVFDLDGTLVDSRLDLAGSANLLLSEFGAEPLAVQQVSAMVGDGARVLVSRVLHAARIVDADIDAALTRFLDIYDQHLVDHTRLYPGVLAALNQLHQRATLAMLTNKPVHHTDRLLDALDLRRYFSMVIGGDSPLPRKPDPAGLLHVIASAGATPDTTLMVGDSIVDIETGRRAGTRVCVARYGFGRMPDDVVLEPGDIEVGDSTDLGARLEAFIAK